MTLIDTFRNIFRPAASGEDTPAKWFSGSGGGNYSGLFSGGFVGINRDLSLDDTGAAYAQTVNIAANRAVDVRRRAVGSMPWRLVEVVSGKPVASSENPPSHPFALALARAHNDLGQSLFSAWELSMVITGKAFILPMVNPYGLTTGVDSLNPLGVHIDVMNGEIAAYRYSGEGSAQEIFQPDELIYERFPTLVSDIYGLAPLYVALRRVNVVMNMDRFMGAFFRNSGRFGQIIKPPAGEKLEKYEVEQIGQQVNASKGSDNAFRSWISPTPVEVETQENPDLSKNDTSIERLENSIYNALGVSRVVAGDTDGQRYQANPEEVAHFYQTTVIPRCRDIQMLVNNNLLPRFPRGRTVRFEFDTSEWDRLSETKQREIDLVRQAYLDGVVVMNQYIETINQNVSGIELGTFENGNVLIVPGGGVLVSPDQLGALQSKPSYITFQSPQTTIQQAGEMGQDAGILNMPTPPPPETNPASEAPAAVVEDAAASGEIEVAEETTEPAPVDRASQDSAIAELRTWRKYAKKHGGVKALDFETSHLEDWQRSRIEFAIKDGDGDAALLTMIDVVGYKFAQTYLHKGELTAAYGEVIKSYVDSEAWLRLTNAHALSIAAQKSIQSTRIDYEDAVEDLFIEAIKGGIDRRRFGNRLRNLTQVAIGKAYLDGLEDGGITDPEPDESDKEWIGNWFDDQRKYIIAVTDAIYKDDRVTEEEAKGKPELWYNKSVAPSYMEGLASASKNGAFEWTLGNTEEHCRSCLKLNGQVRRMGLWKANIMPQSGELACKGYRCDCKLVPTKKRMSRGRLPSWKAAHVH